MLRKWAILVCLAGLFVCAVSGAEAGWYRIVDLGTLPGQENSCATGINDSGQIVGYSGTLAGDEHAVLWQNGTVTDLGTMGYEASSASGINSSGQVVGRAYHIPAIYYGRAFLWQNGTMTDLGTLPGDDASTAFGINSSGQVVGASTHWADRCDAVLWQNGTMTSLGSVGGNISSAYGINDSGHVVGRASTSSGYSHAFLWQNGSMTDLGTLPGHNESAGYGINESGQVVGDSDGQAFLWQNGTMIGLGPGAARGINDSGQVVGGSDGAVVWQDGTVFKLGTLPGGGNSGAYGINNSGQVVGQAGTHAVLWMPVPVGISNKAAYDPIISTALASFSFKVWGKVRVLDSSSFTVDDSSGMPVKVIAPGYTGIANNDYASATGKFSGEGTSRVLNAQASDVVKLN